jgi:hypothetical protein
MPEWTFVLATHTGAALADLNVVPTLRWEENRPAQVQFPLPHDTDHAEMLYSALGSGIPQLRAYLDGELKFSGQFAPLQETSDESQSVATVTFKSPLGRLEQRFRDADVTYTGIDQGTIAWNLIADENTKGATGLVQGTITATVTRDRTYEEGKQILEALTQLSEVQNGGAYWETPLDPEDNAGALAEFNAGPRPGTDRSSFVKFEVGDGTLDNCISVQREIKLPVNRATVLGDAGSVDRAENLNSQATYGVWEALESIPDATGVALSERSNALIVPDPVQIVTFEPDPVNAPRPWVDWWLGDTVSFKADRDALQISTTARPRALEIVLDDQGNETAWHVEWGDQRPSSRVFREGLRTLLR